MLKLLLWLQSWCCALGSVVEATFHWQSFIADALIVWVRAKLWAAIWCACLSASDPWSVWAEPLQKKRLSAEEWWDNLWDSGPGTDHSVLALNQSFWFSCELCQQSPGLIGILMVNPPDMCLLNLWVKVTSWVSYSLQHSFVSFPSWVSWQMPWFLAGEQPTAVTRQSRICSPWRNKNCTSVWS